MNERRAKRGAVVTGRRGSRRGIDRSIFEVVIERRKGERCSEEKSKVTAQRSVYMAVRPRAVQLSRFLGFPAASDNRHFTKLLSQGFGHQFVYSDR